MSKGYRGFPSKRAYEEHYSGLLPKWEIDAMEQYAHEAETEMNIADGSNWMDQAVAERRQAPADYGRVTELALELRDKSQEAKDLEERVASLKKEIYELEHTALPDAMLEAGVDRAGVPGSGNQPGYDLQLKPYVHANIAAGWPEEKRAEAFNYLEQENAADLMSIELVIKFGRGQADRAKDLAARLADYRPQIRPSVPWATLTAWVKEQTLERHRTLELDKIGAAVGSIVKMVQRKE